MDDQEPQREYLQQDGATANGTITYIDQRLISVDLWSPRSPDLSPSTFFLFDNIKNTTFKIHINDNSRKLDHVS